MSEVWHVSNLNCCRRSHQYSVTSVIVASDTYGWYDMLHLQSKHEIEWWRNNEQSQNEIVSNAIKICLRTFVFSNISSGLLVVVVGFDARGMSLLWMIHKINCLDKGKAFDTLKLVYVWWKTCKESFFMTLQFVSYIMHVKKNLTYCRVFIVILCFVYHNMRWQITDYTRLFPKRSNQARGYHKFFCDCCGKRSNCRKRSDFDDGLTALLIIQLILLNYKH